MKKVFLFALFLIILSLVFNFNKKIKNSIVRVSVGTNGCDVDQVDFYGDCFNVLTVFGQKNFKETSEDTVTANKIYHASGVLIDKSRIPNIIYVVDTGNNRILGFDSLGNCASNSSIKCTNNLDCPGSDICKIDGTKEADVIFGQADESSAACNGDNNLGVNKNPDTETLCLIPYPEATNIAEYWMRTNIDIDVEGNLYIPDIHNDRVLEFNQPFSTDQSNGKGDTVADFVIGQDDFNSNGANKGSGENRRDNTSLYISRGGDHVSTRGVSIDLQRNVWVADTFNRRVLRFPENSKQANLVLGQKDFTSSSYGPCHIPIPDRPLDQMCNPTLARVHPETGELYVIDEHGRNPFEARILVFRPPFSNGMSAYKTITPKQDGPFENYNWNYFLQATGFMFNPYKQGEYANGEIWVTEHQTNRVILIDNDGNIIKVIGAPDKYHRGCDYGYYGRCKGSDSIFKDFNLCWPGSSIGIDSAHNIYLPDEQFHRIARFALPYNTSPLGSENCVPDASGGLFDGFTSNSISGYKFRNSVGTFVFENQLIIKDQSRYMVWNNYFQRDTGTKADFIIGQNSENERVSNEFQLGGRAFHTVDDKNRLWTFNTHGKIIIYQLPFRLGASPLANFIKLYWIDNHEEIDYRVSGGLAFDRWNGTIWVSDNKNHRLLRVSNYDNFQDKLYVDMVIGQLDKTHTKCNHDQEYGGVAQGPPTADSLCDPYQVEFDNFGNLYVVENNYECHGNNRIVVFMVEDLRSASGLFPNMAAKKVFIRSNLTEKASCECGMRIDEPCSPVSIAFNSENQMIIGNDGYYSNEKERHLKQIWFYNDPLKKHPDGSYVQGQTPDAYINIPIGAAGEINLDGDDNLIIQDHTWNRVWLINLDQDPSWLKWLGSIPPTPDPVCQYDYVSPNSIGVEDLLYVLSHWNSSSAPKLLEILRNLGRVCS